MVRLTERRKEALASMMKKAIYEAAVVVLTEHGMNGLTMDRVAEQAQVAKGSLYNYFPNKLSLLQFVHKSTIEPIRRRGQEILATDSPALGKLESIIQMWLESIHERRGLFSLLFMDYAVRGLLKCEEETGHASALRDLATIVEQGIAQGDFRQVDPSQVAELLFGAVRQVCEQRLATDREWLASQLTENVMDFFVHGLIAGEATVHGMEEERRPRR